MSYQLSIAAVREEDILNVKNYYGDHQGGPDSGVDLHCFEDVVVPPGVRSFTLKLGVKCELVKVKKECGDDDTPKGYWLVPRSSISKTPLRLANSIGLVDSGYRGELMAKVDNVSDEDYHIKAGDRLFQLVAPNLAPMVVGVVTSLSETDRGENGFGSTGR